MDQGQRFWVDHRRADITHMSPMEVAVVSPGGWRRELAGVELICLRIGQASRVVWNFTVSIAISQVIASFCVGLF